MLFSFALILLTGLFLGFCCKKIKIPSLVGMIATGIILGPYVLNLVDPSILNISSELRRIALIIILMRAGLSLDLQELKQISRPAILMCFLPAAFEIAGYVLIAPLFFDISILDAAILGSVMAAVSPAVIVPRMIKLTEEKTGTDKNIPQMILAGASVDDVFVIVMFSAFTGFAQGADFEAIQFAKIPASIITGLLTGFGIGIIAGMFFKKFHIRDSVKIIIFLSIAFLLNTAEERFGSTVPFSGLLAIMGIGIGFRGKRLEAAKRVSVKFNKLWIFAEILLFVLVGTCVDISYIQNAGIKALGLIGCLLIFRAFGVIICVLGTGLNFKEKIFCVLAYIPKATVQAAIGGIPLAMGLGCGQLVLTIAVAGILITAPLGAFLIDISYKKFLTQEKI